MEELGRYFALFPTINNVKRIRSTGDLLYAGGDNPLIISFLGSCKGGRTQTEQKHEEVAIEFISQFPPHYTLSIR